MFFNVKINGLENKLYCFTRFDPKNISSFKSFSNHTGISSDLYISTCKELLLKIERPKYKIRSNFYRWFFRDFLRKIFILGWDAKREYQGYKIAHSIGLATPKVYCWGGTLSPFSETISFIILEYKEFYTPGFLYFRSLSECDKYKFIEKLSSEAVTLARRGYVHRDFHLNNFLVNADGSVLWIDTHFKRLSFIKSKKRMQLYNSLSDDKLGGYKYKSIIYNAFEKIY